MVEEAEQCRFLSAETARLKVEELKGMLESGKTGDLKGKHLTEKEDIQVAHEQEKEQFE